MPARTTPGSVFGIRVKKSMRRENARVWPPGYNSLDGLLRPVQNHLRPLWWVLADVDYLAPKGLPADVDVVPDTDPRVAKPGYLPTFGAYVSGDWTILCGVPDDPSGDEPLLTSIKNMGWFDSPRTFPPAVSVVIRGVDWAYWDILARDHAVVSAVYEHLWRVEGLHLQRTDSVGNFPEDQRP